MSEGAALSEIRSLGVRLNASRLECYMEVRDRWLLLNMLVNQSGGVAPAYRDSVRAPHMPICTEETFYLLDRQVLDLHWLYCRGLKRSVRQPEFEDLFLRPELDWQMIVDFVVTAVSGERKASHWLFLNDFEMAQLRSLKDKSMRTRFSALVSGNPKSLNFPKVAAALSRVYRGHTDCHKLVEEESHIWL